MANSKIGGVLIPSGSASPNQVGVKTYTPAARYPSSSNPNKDYIVCEVSDGTTSCDCPGWTRRNPPGGRTCKHTQDYEANLRGGHMAQAPVDEFIEVAAHQVGTKAAPSAQAGGSLAELLEKLDKDGL